MRECQRMPVKNLGTLLALKVLNLAPGLTANDRRVAAVLIEHFNRRTNRCDPGLERIAEMVGISKRTVIRCNHRLERAGLFRKIRHGGWDNRNAYVPIWSRFTELENAWSAKLRQKSNSRTTQLSPEECRDCHVDGDNGVTQTCTTNLSIQTCSSGLPKKEITPRAVTGAARASGKPSSDAARDAAEGRWLRDVDAKYRAMPTTYPEVIAAITEEIHQHATDAELQHRGNGLAYIERRLKLGAA